MQESFRPNGNASLNYQSELSSLSGPGLMVQVIIYSMYFVIFREERVAVGRQRKKVS